MDPGDVFAKMSFPRLALETPEPPGWVLETCGETVPPLALGLAGGCLLWSWRERLPGRYSTRGDSRFGATSALIAWTVAGFSTAHPLGCPGARQRGLARPPPHRAQRMSLDATRS
jgi:hypothetical protein